MNTGVDIRLIVMGISFCFLIYSWLNYRKTMKKVKLKREEMDERHNERMRQHDENLRHLQSMGQGIRQGVAYHQQDWDRQFSDLRDRDTWTRRSAMMTNEVYRKTDKLSPTKKIITHKMSMTK